MNNLSRALVLCAAIALIGCAEDDPQQFIEEGKVLFEKDDLKSARVQFKNALQINPKLAEAYYGLALIEEKKLDWQAMKANLQEVIVLDPNHLNARVKLGFLLINQLDKAKEHAAIALKLDSDNKDVILLDSRIYYEEGEYKAALQRADRVLEKDSSNPEAIWLKATILMTEEHDDQAEAVIDQGMEKNPGNIELGTLKVKLHKAQKKFDEVIKDYEVLVASHPDNKELRLEMINILIRYGKHEQVEVAIHKAIETYPEDTGLKLGFIDYLEIGGDAKRVEAQLKDFISASPAELKLKDRLAQLYLAQKRYPEAKTLLQDMLSADPEGKEGLNAKVQLAEIALTEKDKDRAKKLLGEVFVVDAGNTRALVFRAMLRLNERDADGAISDLRIVLRDQPDAGRAMVMMAQAHQLKGEPEVAESYLRKALEVRPDDISAIMPLSAALLKRGDYARAEELLTKAIKAIPDNLVVRELLVRLRVSKKDWVGAEAAAENIQKQPKGVLIGRTLKAMLAKKQGHFEEAIRIYTNILEKEPKAKDVLASLGMVYEEAGRRADYLVFLKDFVKKYPSDISAYNELGRIYALEKQWGKAETTLQQALQIDTFSLATYQLMAGVLEQQGKSDGVVNLYRNGLVKRPDQPMLMLELAKYLVGKQQKEDAIAVYENLLKKYPDFAEAANNLADLLLSARTGSADLRRALTLTERFKDTNNPYFLDTYGWALFKNGDVDNALTALEKSAAALPDNIAVKNHVQEVLEQAKRKNDVKFGGIKG